MPLFTSNNAVKKLMKRKSLSKINIEQLRLEYYICTANKYLCILPLSSQTFKEILRNV